MKTIEVIKVTSARNNIFDLLVLEKQAEMLFWDAPYNRNYVALRSATMTTRRSDEYDLRHQFTYQTTLDGVVYEIPWNPEITLLNQIMLSQKPACLNIELMLLGLKIPAHFFMRTTLSIAERAAQIRSFLDAEFGFDRDDSSMLLLQAGDKKIPFKPSSYKVKRLRQYVLLISMRGVRFVGTEMEF